MKRIAYLFFLFIVIEHSTRLYSQEITFYYDEIVDSLSSQSNSDQLIENLTRQLWDESSSTWVNDSLYEHSYNDKNLVDTIISSKWEDGYHWTYKLRSAYIYNPNDKIILKQFAEWFGSYWYEHAKYQYTYTGSNQNLSRIDIYSFSGSMWYLLSYYVYSWNTNNYVTEINFYSIDLTFPNYYVLRWKDMNYYNAYDLLIRKTRLDYGWRNKINDLFFYDNARNKTENIRQDWNDTDSIWINDNRYLYEYDLNNFLLSIVHQDWQSDSLGWKNVWRETYTYTPQNKIATMFKETWTPETGWNNYVIRTYSYDTNYNWTEKLTLLWGGTIFKNYYRHLATWIEPVSVWETPTYLEEYYLSNNYPNPFNPTTQIKFQLPVSGFVTLKVYDVLGTEVATLLNEEKPAGEYEIEFDGTGLASGMYIYILTTSGYSETKKMILLK